MTINPNNVFSIVEYDAASPEIKAIYDDTKRSLGLPFVLNWFKCQGNNPILLKGNWTKLKSTLMEGTVPNIIKQLIIYSVSSARQCDYCSHTHRVFANIMGKQLVNDNAFIISDNMQSDLIPNSYKIAIAVVSEAALDLGLVNDSYFEKLASAGFNSLEIQELMAQADLVNMLNTIASISGIKIDNELLELSA